MITRVRLPVTAATVMLGLLASALPAHGQGAPRPAPYGWAFSPRISLGSTFDDNVSLAPRGSEMVSDLVTTVAPRGSLDFRGRRTMFGLDYVGSLRFHQELSELNALDQRAAANVRRALSPRTQLFARQNVTIAPTTDELELVGVTYRRVGSRMTQISAGAERDLSRRTSASAAYVFQWVNFDEEDRITPLFRGGVSHGVSANLQRALSRRLSADAEYDLQHAIIGDGADTFDIHRTAVTLHYRLTRYVTVAGGGGYAWFAASREEPRRGAPAFHASLGHRLQHVAWDVSYRRSFMPSFGFGGTFQNEELRGGVAAQLSRRLGWGANLVVREHEPMVPDEERLQSIRFGTTLSFTATRWMRFMGFYSRLYQDARRAGGQVDRSAVGFQVLTTHTVRLP